ncbi:MAG TPA: adenylate/guanylate cyclase domain-containing protein [Verrucomicrobiales bacterium]|nr:adenylate/guanylate cyclase domain-containing protein [Verrucomicrobiales bacterium]
MTPPVDFSRMRHDLRTPVNHIIGYCEMLQEDDAVPAEYLPDLQRIHASGRTLAGLVTELFNEEVFRARSHDLKQLGHDLRTPVNHIIGYCELLRDEATAAGNAQITPDLERISGAARLWLDLVETYLFSPAGILASIPRTKTVAAPSLTQRETAAVTLSGRLLVVDDDSANRDMLVRRLRRHGLEVMEAGSGLEALKILRSTPCDLLLLDMLMPALDGYQTLIRLKADNALCDIPVIMLSALDHDEQIAGCIEAGAEDYLAKPFDPVLLRARIGASLEKRRLRERERQYLADIQAEREKSERLLLNVLPQSIAVRLKQGETMIADHFDCATVLFADLVGFTPLSRTMPPLALVELLNDIFTRFDELAAELGLEKIKTIGDAYMVVAGVPVPRADHAQAAATLALRLNEALRAINSARGLDLHLRTGLHSGSLAAGIIGRHKFSYDLWGDTVNTASRMESSAPLDAIHLSLATAALLGDAFSLTPRGAVAIKGIGDMETWTLQ